METVMPAATKPANRISARTAELFKEQQQNIIVHADQLFGRLMIFQWFFGVVIALIVSPRAWEGTLSQTHLHVWAAVLLGGVITSLPVLLARTQPGKPTTRHVIAVGQMLMSALLIHLTGGRIETHFHVFGSLAILAFYRDWKVIVTASVVVYADHLLRGIFWPQSVYGVLTAPVWRSFEHGGWVVFEVAFLIVSIRKNVSEMFIVSERQANLEALKDSIEHTVAERTAELTKEILERRQAEANLKKSQAQLALAQQISQLGSWEWDIVKNTVIWSEETRRLYAFQPEDSGSSFEACLKRLHPKDVPLVQHAVAEALRTLQPYENFHRVLLPDGKERCLHGRGEIVLNEAGQPIRMIGTAQDVTESKRAEAALRQSEDKLRQAQKMEAVGRLAGGVAHDFNNLLTVIGGYSELMLARLGQKDPLRQNVEEIHKASDRAAALTHQLLAFSRKQVLNPRVLELTEVVSGMDKMLRRLIGEDIDLRTVSDPSLGKVKADPGQIEQVILNLAVNARDAMPRGGKLTIEIGNVTLDEKTLFSNRALGAGEYVMLAVTDTGVGMTDEVQAHLFEPFFTTKGLNKGTGLGLATCYGIISQSGGDIRVYSEPNRGTNFKIYLPRVEANSAIPADDHERHEYPRGTESVLVVEDEDAVRRLTTVFLRDCGYRVEETRNPLEALSKIENGVHFDLVITDVIMPHMNGKELYDRLMLRDRRSKVLFMSGYTDDALAHHGILEGEPSFLEKPFSKGRLASKVRELLDDKIKPTSINAMEQPAVPA